MNLQIVGPFVRDITMSMMNMENKEAAHGRKQADFVDEAEKSVATVQPMDRALAGQQLINAVQSDMPKVTSYPY